MFLLNILHIKIINLHFLDISLENVPDSIPWRFVSDNSFPGLYHTTVKANMKALLFSHGPQ